MEVAVHSLSDTELRLGLPGTADSPAGRSSNKRPLPHDNHDVDDDDASPKSSSHSSSSSSSGGRESTPAAKAQVVGWPPVRSYRKNSFQQAWRKADDAAAAAGGLYVKVSMDGAPYLRKIDLKVYRGYEELRDALDDMFRCFSSGGGGGEVPGKEWNGSSDQYAVAYEDKDGDLMLVGDVPWEMFICSCKKLRMMKGSEARGLESRH